MLQDDDDTIEMRRVVDTEPDDMSRQVRGSLLVDSDDTEEMKPALE